jgi:hypothetical protein
MKPAGKALSPLGEPLDMDAIIVIAIFVIALAVLNKLEFGRVD